MIFDPPRLRPLSDCYLAVEFGDEADLKLNARTLAFAQAFRDADFLGVVEVCPAMAQVAIIFDQSVTSYSRLAAAVSEMISSVETRGRVASRLVTIPVWYDDPWSAHVAEHAGVAHNLTTVASANGFTNDELVARHAAATYWVALVGFTPGANDSVPLEGQFAITAPKYAVPRTYTPARTIGCAGTATCIYPVASPGGYQMIGRSPVEIFVPEPWDDAFRADGVLLKPGDRIRFISIDPIQYDEIRAETAARRYKYEVEEGEIDIQSLGGDEAGAAHAEHPIL
jgi:KipI family sensor histidine kinase inhibitor